MHLPILAGPGDGFGPLGLAAGLVLAFIGGNILIQWQRTRLQFQLMQIALEKGLSQLPGAPPLWLSSLRNGVTTLALGIGLLGFGVVVYEISDNVAMPTVSPSTPGSQTRMTLAGPGDDHRPPPPDRMFDDRHDGPGQGPGLREGPPGGRGFGQDPSLERWRRAQDHQAVATLAMGAGGILILLSFARIGFAFAERKYTSP